MRAARVMVRRRAWTRARVDVAGARDGATTAQSEAARYARVADARGGFVASTHAARAVMLPRRRCAGTNDHYPRDVMVRYVLAVDGKGRRWVTPDGRGDAPGRGTYVAANARALELAVKKRAFDMGFKRNDIHVPAKLGEITREVLRRRLGEVLADACARAGSARALGDVRANEKDSPPSPSSVEEWIEHLTMAQKRIVPDNWMLIPSDLGVSVGPSEPESAESDVVRDVGYKLDALTTEEMLASLDEAGVENTIAKKARDCLLKFRESKDLADAPILVDVDADASFALRIANIKSRVFDR